MSTKSFADHESKHGGLCCMVKHGGLRTVETCEERTADKHCDKVRLKSNVLDEKTGKKRRKESWRNEERTEYDISIKQKQRNVGKKKPTSSPIFIRVHYASCSSPTRARTQAPRLTAINFIPWATDACCFCLLNWLHLAFLWAAWLMSPKKYGDQDLKHGLIRCMF